MKKILRNAAMCKNCRDILVSRHVHDYVTCTCMRQSEEDIRNYEEPKFTKKGIWTKKYNKFIENHHGIAIDGGLDYLSRSWYNLDDLIDLSHVEDNDDN